MIVDVTGIVLIPGNGGKDCPGNGLVAGVECACDECGYLLCCLDEHDEADCQVCGDRECPRAVRRGRPFVSQNPFHKK